MASCEEKMKIERVITRYSEKRNDRGQERGRKREREREREREKKSSRIVGNLRPRNPAFSLRRLKINATTQGFPLPLLCGSRFRFVSLLYAFIGLYLLSILSVLSCIYFPRERTLFVAGCSSFPSYPRCGYFRCLGRLSPV